MGKQSVLYVVGQTGIENQFAPHLIQQYSVSVAHVRREALQMLEEFTPDIILIDVPTIRFSLTRFIESVKPLATSSSIFLMLSKGTRLDQVPKAHGYLRYPATARQLLNRMGRMVPQSQGHTIAWKGLQLNVESRLLLWENEQLPVTPKQAALIQAFFDAGGELVTRANLMQNVWGTDYLGDTRTLDVHIHWMRKALAQLGAPFQIKTERGKGYRFIFTNDSY